MIKNLLGLEQTKLNDYEIMAKIKEAQKKNIGEITIFDDDGTKVRVLLPGRIDDEYMDAG